MGTERLTKVGFDSRLATGRSAFVRVSSVRIVTGIILASLTLLGLFVSPACADVQSTGSVDPARNPFDPVTFPGLPTSGNLITNNSPTAAAQPSFEGLLDVIVGKTSFGEVLINGNTALRYQDLILGDKGIVNNQTRYGTGVMRISGFGAVYNNDPVLLPFGLDYTTFGSLRNVNSGFDAIVGRYGTGTLDISAGGRAELQDSLLVGDAIGAVGSVVVDGIDSFLGVGGFSTGTGGGGASGDKVKYTDGSSIHGTIIGRLGTGIMTISSAAGGSGTGTVAGPTVDTEADPLGDSGHQEYGPIGAILGSSPFTKNIGPTLFPEPGGSGTVTVTGPGSKWIVGGSLQIGGFDIKGTASAAGASVDFVGNTVKYNSQAGRGTLYVNDSALVNLRSALTPGGNVQPPQNQDLTLGIGRFGTLQLDGGTISIGNVTGTANEAKKDLVRILNDGVIKGSGRIETGLFDNRFFGQVRVGAGESLVVVSNSEHLGGTPGDIAPDPMTNFGLMEVVGTVNARAELEFVRAPGVPFKNLPTPVQPAPPAFDGGIISGQHATLRFGSGLENQGVIGFTAGSNIVSGLVHNIGADARFFIDGPDTVVTFEDDVSNTAPAVISETNGAHSVILDRHSFATSGTLHLDASLSNPNPLTVTGDIGLSGALEVSLATDALNSLVNGSAFELIAFGGEAYRTTYSSGGIVIPDVNQTLLPGAQGFNVAFVSLPQGSSLPANVYPIVERLNSGMFLSLKKLGPGGINAMGPDFNGDGVVDNADYAIWKANNGITSGASVLQGDADGDGDVDGSDYLKWLRNAGKNQPWNGAGAGSGSEIAGAVPEPTGLAILLSGMSLVLACGRRRRHR